MTQEHPKRKMRLFDTVAIFVLTACLIGGYQWIKFTKNSDDSVLAEEPCIDEPVLKYGYSVDDYDIAEHTIFPDQFLADILLKYGVEFSKIYQLEQKAKDVFSVRNIRAGKKYAIVRKDSCSVAESFVYEPDPYRYVIYNLKDSLDVKIVEKDVSRVIETTSGIITSSLWLSMKDQGLSAILIDKMEDALAWSVDFYHSQVGDRYKLIYERNYIDGEAVGVGKLVGAYYQITDNEFYAIYYESENYEGFFDLEGRPTKKSFLKSPVKASRISSRYSMSRFHPILRKRKPHLGTDYAAPYGTPIMAVSNGVVTSASYTKGNGKYVKIKHDKTYQTQYLHMQRFAKGIRSGVQVKQGQIIGYVGSTGLATGPHVCFRFWKNGRQINHLNENFPPSEPMSEEELPEFFKVRDQIMAQMQDIHFDDEIPSENISMNMERKVTSETNI